MVNLTASSGINMRLDKYLSEQLVDYSRSQIQAMIQDGKVMIDGRKEKSSYRLQGSEAIVVDPIQSKPSPVIIDHRIFHYQLFMKMMLLSLSINNRDWSSIQEQVKKIIHWLMG